MTLTAPRGLLPFLKHMGTDIAAIRYRAFLSYSRQDVGWAKWLQARLQDFKIDPDLAGRQTALGPVPKTLRPIFRDPEDYSGSDALTDATIEALDRSAALVVLCSPSVVGRSSVNREVATFRSRHPDRPVIPVIVGGAAPDNIPGALRFEWDADGTSKSERPIAITAPDLRETGDGRDLGLARAIAGLTGLGPDDVRSRLEKARRRRRRSLTKVVQVVLLLCIAVSASIAFAWRGLGLDQVVSSAMLGKVPAIVERAVALADKYEVSHGTTLSALAKAETLFDDMTRFERPAGELQYRKALMLIAFARSYEALGDTDRERTRAGRAYRVLAGIAAGEFDGDDYRRDLSKAYGEIGDMLAERGDLPEALKSYRGGHTIIERLAAADSGWQRDLAMSYEKIGDMLADQGNLPEALESYRGGHAVIEQLAAVDSGWQRALAVSHEKIGDVLAEQGRLPEALECYRDAAAILESLAAADPDAAAQRDLAMAYGKIGDVQTGQGQPLDALQSYRDAQNVFDGMEAASPGDTSPGDPRGQHDLAVSYGRLARAFREAHEDGRALDALRQGRAIIARLTQRSPDNVEWQRELAGFDEQLAESNVLPAGQNAIPLETREGTGDARPTAALDTHNVVDEHSPASAPIVPERLRNRPADRQAHQTHAKLHASPRRTTKRDAPIVGAESWKQNLMGSSGAP
jgi:tetratricopeptide (TPR) repeat protein